MSKYKIAVGLTGKDHNNHWVLTASLFNMINEANLSDFEFKVYTASTIYIEVNRNNIAAQFLNDGWGDYLWFLDYDNGFNPFALHYFMEDFEKPDVHIVQGLYYTKDEPIRPTCGVRLPTTKKYGWTYDSAFFTGPDCLINLSKDFGSRCGCIATGCLMVRREVYENVPYPWFGTLYHSRGFYTEDSTFSVKAQKQGYDVYVDTRIKSPHMDRDNCVPPEWKPY